MSYNGSGTYVRSYSWASDATNGILVRSDKMDTEDNGFASALSSVIVKDGQQTTTAVIPFAFGIKTNDGTVSTPAIAFTSESSSGLYRPSASNVAMAVSGVNTIQFSSSNMTAGVHYTVSSATPLYTAGTSTGYMQHSSQNLSNGATASTDFVATADTGTDTTNYVNMGINSSGYSGTGFSNALDGYLYSQSTNLAVGTVASKDLVILTNNTEVGRFTAAGNLAMTGNAGITVNTNKFIVAGATGNTTIAGSLTVNGTTVAASLITKINEVFLTSNGTYTPTAGTVYADVEMVGGGGAGGGSSGTGSGSGGGSGEYAFATFSAATIGVSQTVTMETAGTGSSGANGGNGGTTSFGSLLTAFGGSGGVLQNAGGAGGTGGSGGNRWPGQPGGPGFNSSVSAVAGAGGNSFFGAGGGGFIQGGGNANGNPGTGYGSGGGGGVQFGSSNTAGGAGKAGAIRIKEYISA